MSWVPGDGDVGNVGGGVIHVHTCTHATRARKEVAICVGGANELIRQGSISLRRRTFKEVAIDVSGAKEERVVVVRHDAVHQARRLQPRALRLGLGGRDDVGQAKVLQQLLAVPATSRSMSEKE
jgi:hypothetical protein